MEPKTSFMYHEMMGGGIQGSLVVHNIYFIDIAS